MTQTSKWMGVAVIACGVAFAQKPDAEGNVFFYRGDNPEKIHAETMAIGTGGAIGMARFGVMGPVVKGAPYAAEAVTETTQTLGDGTHIDRRESHTIYRDAEGRIRRESGDEVWISDPIANVSYVLNTKQQTARKMALSHSFAYGKMQGAKVKAEGSPAVANTTFTVATGMMTMWKSDQQGKTEALGKQQMEGVEVDGTRTTMEIPVGQIGNDRPLQIVDERWESAELHVTILEKHSDPMVGSTVVRLTAVRRSEPDPALFEVPAAFQVENAK